VIAVKGAIDAADAGLPVIFVDDARDGLAYAAAAVYGHPAFSLEIVGVTGTNGKTTTTHLVRAAVDGALGGPTCGVVGTVGHAFRDALVSASHTTPEADDLARLLALMREKAATHVAMEVSSHALELGRVRAVRFRVGAFTNLTQDHLDFHGSMESYARTKARLFTECAPGSAVINVDDAFGARMAKSVKAPLVRVSTEPGTDADVVSVGASIDARGIDAVLQTPRGEVRVRSRLLGAHNLQNLAIAIGIVCALDLDLAGAVSALETAMGAPGRLERCDAEGDDLVVLVDYAHTPDALERALSSARGATRGRIWCVFGCGGDRDPSKRAPMGEAAGRLADVVVLTNDNPRSEDPESIARAVQVGLRAARGAAYEVELDRKKAIELAISGANAGDLVLIAGKGHEDYQIVGAEKRLFDDRVEARRALSDRRNKGIS
jgi:UDP-N-acetylmuramoyl-L-alanyl-D-glutamate--2,6-diaminopimelate ligase